MHWEFWFILSILLSIIILGPLVWALWTIYTAVKNREKAQNMVLGTFFTGGLPHHVLCYKQGPKIIPPEVVRPVIVDGDIGPGYYKYSKKCYVNDLWPLNKPKRIQVPIQHLYYNEGNPNPLDPNQDFDVYTSSVTMKAIADEKSATALLTHMREEYRDARALTDNLKSVARTVKYQLIAIAILVVFSFANIIMSLLVSNKVSDAVDIITKVKNGLGIGG